MKLFEQYPYIEGDDIIIRKMTMEDVGALEAFAGNERVYKYLPTFLYEQKYEDKRDVIAKMDEECFDTKESILLGVYCKQGTGGDDSKAQDEQFVGIAEIYNYEESKAKASIGCRLDDSVWGKGVATRVISLLKEYLFEQTDVRTITGHIMKENLASAGAAKKNGFLCKYPNTYGDWGFDHLIYTDKYVYKKEWQEGINVIKDEHGSVALKPVQVEQFVMAYEIEQDRVRAMLPEGFVSLRPVLRINTEIRDGKVLYIEFNTPVEADGRRGWLNIGNWKSTRDEIEFERAEEDGKETVTIKAPFLKLLYKGVGIEGGCPSEKDNEGCYFIKDGPVKDIEFRPVEEIANNKEFCDCAFQWRFHEGDASGVSEGKTVSAFETPSETAYPKAPLTPKNAAAIPCKRVLGSYIVRFERYS